MLTLIDYPHNRHLAPENLNQHCNQVGTHKRNAINLRLLLHYQRARHRNLIEVITPLIVAQVDHDGAARDDDGDEGCCDPKGPVQVGAVSQDLVERWGQDQRRPDTGFDIIVIDVEVFAAAK